MNRIMISSLCLSMISGQTLRVCPEGKLAPTFPDHALAGLARGLYRIGAGLADQRGILSDRRRLAEEIALDRVAALIRQEAELLLGFHAFGDNRHFETVAKADDRANDRRRLRIAPQIHDESPVDLDLVERERLKIAQRGIAAAEI